METLPPNRDIGEAKAADASRRMRAVALVVIALFVLSAETYWWLNAGPLWRDEVNSVDMAGVTSISEIPANLQYESFPIVYFLVLRAWTLGGAAAADLWIRLLGLLVAVGVVGSAWFSARAFKGDLPLVAVALFAAHPVAVRYVSSTRGYGLGAALIIGTFALVWRATADGSRRHWIIACAVALVAVHTMYQSWFLLIVICAASVTVSARRRDFRQALRALGLGAICGISVLPYLGTLRAAREWNHLAWVDLTAAQLARDFGQFMRLGGLIPTLAWVACGALCVAALVLVATGRLRDPDGAVLFAAVTAVGATVVSAGFLLALDYAVRPWYFLPWAALFAVAVEPIVWRAASGPRGRLTVAVLAIVVVTSMVVPVSGGVSIAHTNLAAIGAVVGEKSTSRDLVVVYPWMYGISFARYYHGAAPWTTMVPVPDHRWHRYDQYLNAIDSPRRLDELRGRVRAVLEDGGRVWLVTTVPFESQVGGAEGYMRDEQFWRVAVRRELDQYGSHVFGPWMPPVKAAYLEDSWIEVWQKAGLQTQTAPVAPVPSE